MTTPEFRDILQRDVYELVAGSVIVNYNPVQGSTPATVTVDDIAVVIGTSDLAELQEATSITFKIPGQGVTHTINVQNSINPTRVVERGAVGSRYYLYSIRTPEQRPVISAPGSSQENYVTEVSIEPTVSTGVYEYNVYNAIIGNSIGDRESSYRVDCDRSITTKSTKTNPTNIFNILDDIASPAQVQDSLYSDTGWINARYEGTKLSPSNNSGTDPVLQGTFFEAAYFASGTFDATINNILETSLDFKQYLSSGKISPPEYDINDPAKVFSIEGTVVQLAEKGRLRVKEIGNIINIDSTGSLAPSTVVV